MIFEHFEGVIKSVVGAFRLGMEAQGGEGLIAIIDSLPSLIAERKELALEMLNELLTEILSSQSRKDFLFLADLLEYELLPLLRRNH